MAKAKKPKLPGRPKAVDPMKSFASIKGTPAYEAWFDEVVEHTRQGTRTQLLRNAVRAFAEAQGFVKPPPKR